MKIQRTLPPVAAPIGARDLLNGLAGLFSGDREVARLEQEIRDRYGVRHVFPVSSGKAALYLILEALKTLYPDRLEVVIPAYTCFSVPSAIEKAGLKISPCDVNPETLDFKHTDLKESINGNTLCVIATHMFGIPSEMDSTVGICSKMGIVVVEDAAQSMDGIYKGRRLGTIGDAGFFSFGRGKNVTCGNGGVLLTNSDAIASAVRGLYAKLVGPSLVEETVGFLRLIVQTLFLRPSLYWFPSGIPSLKLGETIFHKDFPVKRLSGMSAGVLKRWHTRLTDSNRVRRDNAEQFKYRLTSKFYFIHPQEVPVLRLPVLVMSKEARDEIYRISVKSGLGLSKMYPSPVNEIEEIKEKLEKKSFPGAKSVCERLVNIPVHELLSDRDKDEICRVLEECA